MSDILEQYRKIYEMLEDEESRDIYLDRIDYLISHDPKYIKHIVDTFVPDLPFYGGATVEDLKRSIPKDRKVVLYGAGTDAKSHVRHWMDDDRFIGFCSQTKEKQKNGYLGYPVMSPEELLSRKDLSVVISTSRARVEILRILRDGGYPEELIFDIARYFPISHTGQYFAPSFMRFGEEEVFVDAGCCDLNSSLELRKYCPRVKKVYAFEPDPENYAICQEKRARFDFKEVELIPYGAWSERTTLSFAATNDGSSHIGQDGNMNIPVMPIDEAIDAADKITMIKMDIEGAELEALKGARKTIQRDKPKLAVCIYHKPEDMIQIPMFIKELVPEYKLYVRHHSNHQGETVLYAVMP